MLDEALDNKDVVRLHRWLHLPHTDSVATHTVAAAYKDADVGKVAAVAHLHLLQDVHPPSCLSRRVGHQDTWDYLRPLAEDIMRHRPRHSKPSLLEPHETIRKLECVLFLWFRCGGRSYQPNVPPVLEEAGPRQLLHPTECAAIH